jgi:hypothetical protein
MFWYVHISFWNIILEYEVDSHDENMTNMKIIMNLNTKKESQTQTFDKWV